MSRRGPSHAELGEQLDHTGVSLDVVDRDGRWIAMNRTFLDKTGFAESELLGRTPREVIRSDYHSAELFDDIWRQLLAGHAWSGRLRSLTKSGDVRVWDTLLLPALRDGELDYVSAIRTDVTDQQQREDRHGAVITAALDGVLVSDWESAQFIDVNPAARELFGYGDDEFRELTGRLLCDAGQDALIDDFSAQMYDRGHYKNTLRFKKKDGTVFWGDISCATFRDASQQRMVTIIRDVDDRVRHGQELEASYARLRATQAQLMHASQLATIGQLAAGVAHEINNPANYVGMSLEILRSKLVELGEGAQHEDAKTLVEDMHELLDHCVDGNDRIAGITRDLRTYGRLEDEEVDLVDVVDVARAAVRMVNNELRHVADLVTELNTVPRVRGGGMKIGQLITNLLVNAAHAVGGENAGSAEVRLEIYEDGGDVCIVVSDSGTGIPESVRTKIFEPFFTTKPRGQGTGLGLSLCAEIVRQHSGTIDITSAEGEGTRVEVRLPAIKLATTNPPPSADITLEERPRLRVLVIDDEPVIREVYERVLSRAHEVVMADGGARALEFLANDTAFDVVVCDLMMPELDGLGVFERVDEIAPFLTDRMLFVTGGAITERTRAFVAAMDDRVLQKPIKPRALLAAVDRMGQSSSEKSA